MVTKPKRLTVFTIVLLILVVLCTASAPQAVSRTPRAGLAAGTRPQYAGLNAYYGEMHQHTGHSWKDACGLPETAIRSAMGRSDFLAITEHQDAFYTPYIGDAGTKNCRLEQEDPNKWATLGALAERFTKDGTFVVLRGYEHTRDLGHVNVFNSEVMNSPLLYDDFYAWLATQPPDTLAQFNHPLSFDWARGMGDFGGFDFFPPVAAKMRTMENALYDPFYVSYPTALAKEWQVSSVGYTDFHYADQAGARHNYGIFAANITKNDLLDALRNGRTFGNTDGSLAVALLADGRWMGTAATDEHVVFQAYAADRNGDTITRIELMGKDGVLASYEPGVNPAECTFSVEHVQPGDFFYLHVIDSHGDHAWSGSISRPLYSRLQANPAAMEIKANVGATGVATRTCILQTNDGEDAPWQAEALDDWVQISPSAGEHLPATVTVTVSLTGLGAGIHDSGIAIRTVGDSHVPLVEGIQVNVGSTRVPTLTLAPRRVEGGTPFESPVISGTLAITSSDPGMGWVAMSSVPWLTVSTPLGQGTATLTWTADLSRYRQGPYSGHVIVMAGSQIRISEITVDLQPWHAQTLVLQQGLTGYQGVSDTYLNEWDFTTHYGRSPALIARQGGIQVPLLRFDLTQIPQDSDVHAAKLRIYARYSTVPNGIRLQTFEVLKPWDENTSNWALYAAGHAWARAGATKRCDDTSCEPATIVAAKDTTRWYEIDITPLVQRWVASPAQNHGLALVGSSEVQMAMVFDSSQAPVERAAYRPHLSVVYGQVMSTATPTPTPSLTPSPTPSPTPTATLTPTAEPTPTETATPSPTLSLTPPAYSAGVHLPLVVRN